MAFFQNLNPVIQALVATGFTWAMTALGAAIVFTARDFSRRILDAMLGFAAGVMIFVVIEEVVPEAQRGGNTDLATAGGMVGFAVMMLLDVAFA